MPLVTLTDITLRSLRAVEGKQVTYIDKTLKGFGVRVTEAGAMSYVLTHGPDRQRVKLGDVGIVPLKAARAKAKTILAEKQLGLSKPATSPTFDEVKTLFLSVCEHKNKTRTVRDYTRLLNRHFAFGSRRIADVSPEDINRRLDRLQKTVSEQNHALVAIKVLFRFAQRRHYLQHSPCEGMQPLKRPPRDRVLTDAELVGVYETAEKVGYPFGTILQLCILTGQRRTEIAWLRRSYISDDVITLPASLTKNKRRHAFPIGATTRAIIAALPEGSDLLFPALRGDGVFGGWSKQKTAFDEALTTAGYSVQPWTLHDLRRTFATQLAALSTPIHITERLLNHVSGTQSGIVAVYQRHDYADEMRATMTLYEKHLAGLLAAG